MISANDWIWRPTCQFLHALHKPGEGNTTLPSGWRNPSYHPNVAQHPSATPYPTPYTRTHMSQQPNQAQHALNPPPAGWMSLEETLSILPGPLFEDLSGTPRPPPAACPPPPDASLPPKARHVALVFVVGGVTASEVACMRALARECAHDPTGVARMCVIGSTKLLSGDQLLGSFYDSIPSSLRSEK